MLSMLVMGVGGEEVNALLSFLDLPHAKSFGRSSLPHLEEEIGEFIRDTAVLQLKKALEEEICLMLEKNITMGEEKNQSKATHL